MGCWRGIDASSCWGAACRQHRGGGEGNAWAMLATLCTHMQSHQPSRASGCEQGRVPPPCPHPICLMCCHPPSSAPPHTHTLPKRSPNTTIHKSHLPSHHHPLSSAEDVPDPEPTIQIGSCSGWKDNRRYLEAQSWYSPTDPSARFSQRMAVGAWWVWLVQAIRPQRSLLPAHGGWRMASAALAAAG